MKPTLPVLLALALGSCTNDNGSAWSAREPAIYAHYDVSAEEGGEVAVSLFRFYTGPSRKTTLTLQPPYAIALDGEPLAADSTRYSGAFYELQKPLSRFGGRHTISFTGRGKRAYEEEFRFTPLTLLTPLDGPLPKRDLVLELGGLEARDQVRIVLLDTSFTSEGINRLDSVRDGRLVIKGSQLATLRSGPVVLEISKEAERPLRSGLEGIFTYTYTLRRNIILRD